MSKNRLEAFSDGVIAIIITIMVLELKVPEEGSYEALIKLMPHLMSYVISFIYIATYWNNHHHLIHSAKNINGKILWANNHLLFWLSLIPFVTAWSGENIFEPLPIMLYGIVLLFAAMSYYILAKMLVAANGEDSVLARAMGKGDKEKLALLCFAIAITLAYVQPLISASLYVFVALLWFMPDSRIEKVMNDRSQ